MKIHSIKIISLVLAGVLMLSGCSSKKETKKTTDKKADSNKTQTYNDPTKDVTFSSLPLGDIAPEGWLRTQLTLLADNIASDMETLSPDLKTTGPDRSGWLGGTGENWERGPYYVRGLVSLSYMLKDRELMNKAQKWIDWTLESQMDSGAFGPFADDMEKFDYWAVMPMLMALEEYYDATKDERVIPFLQKYFKFQEQSLSTKPLTSWATYRAGDNIFAVWWLYEKTGDENLKKLCTKLHTQAFNWETVYSDEAWSKTYHIVNVHQSLKLLPTMYALTGKQGYLDAYYKGIENLYMASGRQDGMSNGDENTRGIGSTYGTETCAVAERIISDKIALMFTKDATIADHLENVGYNSLPQQLLPDGKGHVYYTMQNQVSAALETHGFTTDGNNRLCYGAISGYPCCVHNFLIAWPSFVDSTWMTTSDKGLAVGAYGPTSVTATVGNSTKATIKEETNYPYEDTVALKITADKEDTYPIYVRVPEWCKKATVTVNGKAKDYTCSGEYIKLQQKWKSGDTVTLKFPMEFAATLSENNSVSIKYGPTLFALKVEEKWSKLPANTNDWNLGSNYACYAIEPVSDWNYALADFDFSNLSANFKIKRNEITDNMKYTQDYAPIELTVNATKLPDWSINRNNVSSTLPVSPVSDENTDGDVTTVTLIPFAFARLKVALMPWTGERKMVWKADADSSKSDTMTFSGVIVPHGDGANENFTFKINYSCKKDIYVYIYVNKKEYRMVNLKKGENTLNASFKTDGYFDKYNCIEITTVDGKKIPEDFKATVTVN